MIQKKAFGIITLAVIGLGISSQSLTSLARADGSTTTPPAGPCSIGVCDIPAELTKLTGMHQADRFAEVTQIHAAYKNSTDLATLKNLADFATQVAALFTQLKEDAFMIREANGFYGDMVIGLAKYSPLDGPTLAGYYAQLSGESNRYAVVTYWEGRIADFDKKDQLLQLLDFFGRAEKISETSVPADPDYIPRECKGAEDKITARLVQLYPYFEGTYTISVKCNMSAGETIPAYCQDSFIDRLVIMDTMQSNGLQVTLANSETGTTVYTFANVLLSAGGTTFEATGSPSGVLSMLHLVLDRATGKLSGYIRNSDSLSQLSIDGSMQASPSSVYDVQALSPNVAPLTAAQISGTYKGQYNSRSVTFTIVSMGIDQFGATMSFDEDPSFKLRFQYSRFYSNLGVLVLVANTQAGAHVKLTMFISSAASNGLSIQGFGFTDLTGATQQLSLSSVAAAQ